MLVPRLCAALALLCLGRSLRPSPRAVAGTRLRCETGERAGERAGEGVEVAVAFLNEAPQQRLLKALATCDPAVRDEMDSLNFWSGGSFEVRGVRCEGIVAQGLRLALDCSVKGRPQQRSAVAPFPFAVADETALKRALIAMAFACKRMPETGRLAALDFGEKLLLPLDFRFNDVPHAAWVRAFVYDLAAEAFAQAVNDASLPDRSRLQMQVNIPEMNPAFDTYRIGTVLEMVRRMALAVAYQGRNVRILVQQPLGEGVFVGLPLALASMRVVLERMDWGTRLSADTGRIAYGCLGPDVLAEDDHAVIVIAPQNVVGAEVTGLLEQTVVAAGGRPLVLVNPSLGDRPSSNNVMQVRGRKERRAVMDSFRDVFVLRLLYPSSGGYMFPIGGLVLKPGFYAPYVAYGKGERGGREEYLPVGAFPPHPKPDADTLSNLFMYSE